MGKKIKNKIILLMMRIKIKMLYSIIIQLIIMNLKPLSLKGL